MVKLTFLLAVFLSMVAFQPRPLVAQENEQWRSWNQPVEPFRVMDNIYYVGANEIAAFLITSSEGHILIDGGFPETAAIIHANVAKLGFQIEEVEILLNSHAHFDHAGGLAELKRLSGAQLFISNGDADLIENGGKGDFLLGDTGLFPPVSVDRRLVDGDVVSLGGVTLTAHLTAGHTRGCTTWTMTVEEDDQTYEAVFVCSATVLPNVRLVDQPSYPGIAEDFARTFEVLRALPCDVFLASHGSFFGLRDKIRTLGENPAVNPFIDPARYRAYVERGERRFHERLNEEQKVSGRGGEP